jgi:hypothetical protein
VLKFRYVLRVVLLTVAAICFTLSASLTHQRHRKLKPSSASKDWAAAYFEPDAQKNQAVSSLEEMFSEHNPKSEKETNVGIVETE